MSDSSKDTVRQPQLAYSELQDLMHDEAGRRAKANKLIRVLHHFLGRDELRGLRALDIGCSTGFIANEIALDGAESTGVDIDVPGLKAAEQRFGDRVTFRESSGDRLPFGDESFDIIIFNQIYEHVVDAQTVVDEIRRVLRPTGLAYLGLGNKFQIMEPHYHLPLLSWLPKPAADRYIRRAGKADEYYEKHRSRSGLKQLFRGFHIYDYTIPVIRHPDTFGSGDQVPSSLARLPVPLLQALLPIVPTYIWVGTKQAMNPVSRVAAEGLSHLDLTGTDGTLSS